MTDDTPTDADSGTDAGDGDRLLTLAGIGILLAIVFGIGVVLLAGTNATTGTDKDVPEADWTLDRINDTHVRIVHAGGDPVEGERLVILVDSVERQVSWPSRVTEGQGVTVQARPDSRVQLVYVRGRDDQIQVAAWARV